MTNMNFLKFTILKTIVENFGIKEQKRNIKLLSSKITSLSKKELEDEDKSDELLEIDALSPFTWNQYSLIALQNDYLILHYFASLIHAVLLKFDAKMWAYLTILATTAKLTKSLSDIANTAYFYCRENYFSVLDEMMNLENNKDLKDKDFVSYIESLVQDPKEYSFELRLWNGDEVKILNFSK